MKQIYCTINWTQTFFTVVSIIPNFSVFCSSYSYYFDGRKTCILLYYTGEITDETSLLLCSAASFHLLFLFWAGGEFSFTILFLFTSFECSDKFINVFTCYIIIKYSIYKGYFTIMLEISWIIFPTSKRNWSSNFQWVCNSKHPSTMMKA